MVDTLIREGESFQGTPPCPVPQYWTGTEYEKVQGAHGATRAILYDASGNPLFTSGNKGAIELPAGAATEATLAAIAGYTDGIETALGLLGTQVTAAAILAKLSSDPATQTTLAAVLAKLSADPATQTTLAAVLAKLSADPATQTTLAAINTKLGASLPLPTGAASESTLSTIATELGVVGAHANAWSAVSVSIGGDSTPIDCRYQFNISVFGNASAATTITVYVSQDNTNFYATSNNVVLGGSGDFHISFQSAARYIRLRSSAAATITATIAGK